MMKDDTARGCGAKAQAEVETLVLTEHLWPTYGPKSAWYQTNGLIIDFGVRFWSTILIDIVVFKYFF